MAEFRQIVSERGQTMVIDGFDHGIPLFIHRIGEPRGQNRACYRRNRVAVSSDVRGEKDRRLGGLHHRRQCDRERHDRQRVVREILGSDIRGQERWPSVQIGVDGANRLREYGVG